MSSAEHPTPQPAGQLRPGRRRSPRRALVALAASTMFAAAVPAVAGAAATKAPSNSMTTGSALLPGHQLVSSNRQYRFVMQRDGNLVEYQGKQPKWASNTGHHAGAQADLQRDGNFVIYDGKKALWAAGTFRGGSSANVLVVQDDGNIVIYNGKKALWWTNHPPPTLQLGSTGPAVWTLQRRLSALKYWLGTPDGSFGDATQQAVWAFQKAAGIPRSGVVGPATWHALALGVEPKIRSTSGNLIEVNLSTDLVMIVQNGKLWATLNTSTGGGYQYVQDGVTNTATTPTGVFSTFSAINGIDKDSLGTLWRPRFFYEGYAIHGDDSVPPYPVSHGCVRVSNEAIDWIWTKNLDPIGEEVWVY
jgi:peptidoglycan hydrolase-like protein with peptidoglycan-binding domain